MHESAIKGSLPMMGQSDYKKQGESRGVPESSNLNCMENFSTLVLSMFIVVQMTLERLQIKIRRSLSWPISFKLLTVAILLVFSSFKRQGTVGLFKGNGTTAVGLTSILLRQTHPTTALLLLGSFLFFLLQFRTKKHKDQKSPPLPPGPMPWPVVGNLIELVMNKPAFRWILRLMKEMNTEIACIKLGNVHVIPVTSPEIGCEFLKKQDAIFASRPLTMASEHLSRGYLSVATAPLGDRWKRMRRVMAYKVLGPARLKWLVNKRVEEADNLVRYLYNQCRSSRDGDGAVVNVRVAARQYSGNVIRKMMFNQRYFGIGRSDGGPGVEEQEHVEAIFTELSVLYAFCVSDYMPGLRWLDLDGHEKIVKKAIKVVNKYHEPIIDERIKKWRSGANGRVRKEPEDLLDILISVQDTDGKPLLTPEEIKAEAAV